MAKAFSSEDFDTPLRNERQLADIQAEADEIATPTEPDAGIWVRKDTAAAKGDLFIATAASAVGRQASSNVNGDTLQVDTSTTTGWKVAAPVAPSLGYLQYVALLTQAGGAAPVATVQANTLGGTVVWVRTGVGIYTATLASAFTASKTWPMLSSGITLVGGFVNVALTSTSVITVTTSDITASAGDDILNVTAIEIRVYA